MAIDMYKVYESEQRFKATADYIAAPEFADIEIEANSRGYRKATISEINASAERTTFAPDLFCWRGGLWVAA